MMGRQISIFLPFSFLPSCFRITPLTHDISIPNLDFILDNHQTLGSLHHNLLHGWLGSYLFIVKYFKFVLFVVYTTNIDNINTLYTWTHDIIRLDMHLGHHVFHVFVSLFIFIN